MKIVILDGYSANPGDLSWEPLREFGELTVYERTASTDIIQRCSEADIVLTNKVVLTADILSQLPSLKYIGVLATGYNVVDIETARKRGIIVTNIPAYSTDSVAQIVFAHLLNITNSVDHYARQNRDGRWSSNTDFCYWDTPLTELAQKKMGIVGLGNIGMKVADIAHAFGMEVIAYTSKKTDILPYYIKKVSQDELFAESDVLSLHCPLTPDTRHFINAEALAKMKPTAILINTGRGPLVNDQAVAEALTAHRLKAYAADVMTTEPPSPDNPLLHSPNAYLTPHIAWATSEARIRLVNVAIDNVVAFISGQPKNVVS